MASCYHCGIKIKSGEGYRRQVLTSQSTRVYFSKRGGGSYGQTYGLRTLCIDCAQKLDQNNKELAWKLPASLVVGLLGALIAFRFRDSFDGAAGGMAFLFLIFGGAGLITFFTLGLMSSNDLGLNDRENKLDCSVDSNSTEETQNCNQFNSRDLDSSVDMQFYFEAIRDAGAKVESLGLSFFGIYGLETSQNNAQYIAEMIFKMFPPESKKEISVWKNEVFENTCKIFLKKFSSATNPLNLDVLMLIFPTYPEESLSNYLHRLHHAAKIVISIIHPEFKGEDYPI